MGGLFGKHKHEEQHGGGGEITAHDRAVLDLKVQRDKVTRQKKKTRADMRRLTEMAKELIRAKRKDRALLVLKKKKAMAVRIEQLETMLDNVENLVNSLEFADHQAQVFAALKSGASDLKAINASMDIDEVQQIMDDTQEAVDYQNELADTLAGTLGNEYEDDLEAELDALLAAEADDVTTQLPSVPNTDPVAHDDSVYSDDPVEVGASAARSRRLVAA